MTESSDNDKTRIKLPSNNTAVNSEEGADKTRIAPKQGAQREAAGNDSPNPSPEVDEARRLAAQKKARELEKRLAEIASRKNGQQAAAPEPKQPDSSDGAAKTVVGRNAPPQPQAPATPQQGEAQGSDKTQINSLEAAPGSTPAENADRTVFKPRGVQPQDKTKVVTGGPSDPTSPSAGPISETAPITSGTTTGGLLNVDRQTYIDSGHELLKGRFVFEEILGAGGMGVVYKAKDLLKVEAQDKDPYVAIKVLGDEFKAHPEAFIALQRESRKTQRIAHPNIVNVHDFDRDGDTVFMTMEFLEGKPLDKLISQYKSTGLPDDDAWKILEGISKALIYAHEQKIIHSDFKPGNIFVTSSNIAKVFDFGIARAVAKAEKIEESADDKTVFDAGNLGALTPAYASLEMLEGETPDIRDDIYALGCIAYEMFTGNHPFNRVHANEAMKKKLKPKRIPNISKSQWKVIEKALAFKREDRIATVDDFWRQITHKRSSAFLLSTAAVVVVAVASVFVYQNYFAPSEPNVDTDKLLTEFELKFSIKQNKDDLEELLATLEFSSSWERKLWEVVQALRGFLGEEDAWLIENEAKIYQAYLAKIEAMIAEEDFEAARDFHKNAFRYTKDQQGLADLSARIDEAQRLALKRIEDEKKQQQLASQQRQKQQADAADRREKNKAYDVAMGTVNKQLQCRSSVNMRDIDIAVNKLRSLNPGRYRKEEDDIVSKLSLCISKIGRSFPERAEELKKRAQRTFPGNSVVAAIKIEPKDPCDKSLAGHGARGARAVCRDPLKSDGDSIGRGPALVVIPAKGSLKTFAIGKYEIMVEDLNRFCADTKKCEETKSKTKHPKTNVDIKLIQQYLSWLSSKSKRKYRLPTRAEWVYASRSNSSKQDSNRNCRLDSRGIKKGGLLIKARTGQQNGWGLVNYLGNAREIVVDGTRYSAMGGSFETSMQECEVTTAQRHDGSADKLTGFRVLREI